MNELVWFYFTIIINIVIGFATYYASKRDRKKRINGFKKIQDDELERVRKKFDLRFFRSLYLERNIMNELERTALNEVLRTVAYIAEKLDKIENAMLTYQEADKHPKD
ncbi:hypothetical protein [Streptococcus pneumoniae]|nr:hypothetical protein [Streptococcus pneumoniae]HEW6996947.1 hypothetical protein [Streptococcus pneumoniae]